MTEEPTRIQRIIREHVHDVRNSINGLDLLTVMVEDLSSDPAMSGTLAMMRAELTRLEAATSSLQFKFAAPQPSTVTAGELMQMWKTKIAPLENSTHLISWSALPQSGTLTVDVNAILSVLGELVVGGWYRSKGAALQAAVDSSGPHVTVEVRESKPWMAPAAHYIAEARRLVETNGGTLELSEDTVSQEREFRLKFPSGA